MEDPNTGLKSWFYAKRSNFGANGWDKLVGDVDIHTIDGDHFSIVTPPHVSIFAADSSLRVMGDLADGSFIGQGARTDSTQCDGEVGRVVDVKVNWVFAFAFLKKSYLPRMGYLSDRR